MRAMGMNPTEGEILDLLNEVITRISITLKLNCKKIRIKSLEVKTYFYYF